MGNIGRGFIPIVGPFLLAGQKAPKPPQGPNPPAVGAAPMSTDVAAQTAATEAGIQQSKYGLGQTVLTGGKGVPGASVTRPGLIPGSDKEYPTIFAKYLGD